MGVGRWGSHINRDPSPGQLPSAECPLSLYPGGLPHSKQRKAASSLVFFSSRSPWLPQDPPLPSLRYVTPGLFLRLSTSLLGGNPSLGIPRCEDRRRGGERALPACLSGTLHAAWSNNALSISWCVPMRCMPDALGREGEGAKLWVRPAMVQSPQLACLYGPVSCCHPGPEVPPTSHGLQCGSRSSVSYYHSLMKPPKSVNLLFLILSIIT